MVYHNLTNITSDANLGQTIIGLNNELVGLPFIAFITFIWIGIFIFAKGRAYETPDAIIISSFVVTITTIFGFFADLVAKEIIILPLLLLFVGVIIRSMR